MSETFTKLFNSILTSSIWAEDDATRLVWIAMLAMCDKDGYVGASLGGLAHAARVSRESCQRALEVLSSPDPDSRSQENEGRRIRRVERGWLVLNYRNFRDMKNLEEKRKADRERKRRQRARHS